MRFLHTLKSLPGVSVLKERNAINMLLRMAPNSNSNREWVLSAQLTTYIGLAALQHETMIKVKRKI